MENSRNNLRTRRYEDNQCRHGQIEADGEILFTKGFVLVVSGYVFEEDRKGNRDQRNAELQEQFVAQEVHDASFKNLTRELSDAGPVALTLEPRCSPGIRWSDFVGHVHLRLSSVRLSLARVKSMNNSNADQCLSIR